MRRILAIVVLTATMSACGTASEEPTGTTERPGESIGVADGVERAQRVADRAEDRLNQMDDLAPSP